MNTVPCKSCRKPIRWVVTANGKRMPIDPAPSTDGNLVLDDRGVAHFDWRPGRAKYVSHFATCPNAAQHRRRR